MRTIMCWYYRVRYSCGGEVWGSRQRQCLKSKQNDATKPGEKCTLRRFTRRLHDGAECPVCCGDQQRQHENPDVDCATAHQQPLRDLFARCEYEPRNTDKDLWKIWFALLRFTTRGPYGRAELDRVSAPVFCRRCTSQSGHEGPHKLQCPEIDCTLPPDHEDSHGILPHFRWCDDPECGKEVGHSGPHRFAQGWQPCTTTLECTRGLGHEGDHSYLSVARQDSRTIDEKLGEVVQEHSRRASQLNRLVLVAMGAQAAQERSFPGVQAKLDQEQRQTRVIQRVRRDHGDKQAAITLPFATGSTYERLDYQSGQIRLFELQPSPNGESIIGSFIYTNLGACPEYTALSYAWGDTTEYGSIKISDDKEISIAENLWRFLLVQSRSISEPRFFWIDAICIDQDNVDERNHQVALMEAHLLPRSRGSTSGWARPRPTASWPWTFLAHRASRAPAAQKGLGTPPVWTDHEGAALRDLCEREYWRRMWIIQEVIHADRIRVWCGARNIDWAVFDRLYLTLKTLEDTSWFAHHRYVMPVLQSFAFTMVSLSKTVVLFYSPAYIYMISPPGVSGQYNLANSSPTGLAACALAPSRDAETDATDFGRDIPRLEVQRR